MSSRITGYLACVLSLTLAACGGGGGGGGSGSTGGSGSGGSGSSTTPTAPVDNSWLQITSSANSLTLYEGDTSSITVDAVASKTIAQAFNVAIIDKEGVIDPKPALRMVSQTHYQAELTIAKQLAPGAHTTSLEVRLCEDDPLVCAKPIPGSPWQVPLKVTIRPQTNLTTLSQLSGVPAWSGYKGNALHSRYVPASLETANISRRWQWSGDLSIQSEGIAVAGGQLFIVGRTSANASVLKAIDESTGKENWTATVGTAQQIGGPVVVQGKVVVQSNDSNKWFAWYYDAKTGALLHKQTLPALWAGAHDTITTMPTVSDDGVYFAQGGLDPGITKYDPVTYAQIWARGWDSQDYDYIPSIDGSHAYAFQDGKGLVAYDIRDGREAYAIPSPFKPQSGDVTQALVLSGNGMAYSEYRDILHSFDLSVRKETWSTPISGGLAVAPDVLYLVRGAELEARDPKSGKVLWSVVIPTMASASMLATKTHVFISQGPDMGTYALDVRTRKFERIHNLGGSLALSDRGVLYIMQNSGSVKIIALNLQ